MKSIMVLFEHIWDLFSQTLCCCRLYWLQCIGGSSARDHLVGELAHSALVRLREQRQRSSSGKNTNLPPLHFFCWCTCQREREHMSESNRVATTSPNQLQKYPHPQQPTLQKENLIFIEQWWLCWNGIMDKDKKQLSSSVAYVLV